MQIKLFKSLHLEIRMCHIPHISTSQQRFVLRMNTRAPIVFESIDPGLETHNAIAHIHVWVGMEVELLEKSQFVCVSPLKNTFHVWRILGHSPIIGQCVFCLGERCPFSDICCITGRLVLLFLVDSKESTLRNYCFPSFKPTPQKH